MNTVTTTRARLWHRPELGCHRLAQAIAWKAERLGAGKLSASGIPDLEGGIIFRFDSRKGRMELLWQAGEGDRIASVPGSFSILELSDYQIEKPIKAAMKPALGSALARADFSPFSPTDQQPLPTLSALTRDWLVPGCCGWFGYTLHSAFSHDEGLQCVFMDKSRTLHARLSRALADSPPVSGAFRIGGIVVTFPDDPRNAPERGTVAHQIERLFAFVLSRVRIEGVSARQPDPNASDDAASVQLQRLRAGAMPLENIFRLPADQNWRQFMAEGDTAHFLGVGTQPSDCNAYVWHSDKSCFHMRPSLHGRLARLIHYPWALDSSLGSGLYFTNMTDRDIITDGAEERLDQLLDHCAETGAHDQVILLENTCIPKILGQDLRQVGQEFTRRNQTPLLQSHPGQAWKSHLGGITHMYLDLMAHARREEPPVPNAINLIGFNPGRGLDELVSLLSDAGVCVNSQVFPTVDLNHVRRYYRAGLQVFRDCAMLNELYDEVFVPTGLSALRPPMPFGMEATRRFLEAITTALGLGEEWKRLWDARSESLLAPCLALREKARGLRVGFVCDVGQASRLWNPERTLGLNILGWLAEFGFGADVLLYEPEGDAEVRTALSAGLSQVANEQGADNSALSTLFFADRDELRRSLLKSKSALFFSEYTDDPRLSETGKAGFSLLDIEMGFAGSLRCLRRLLARAKAPCYRALIPASPEDLP